MYSNKHIHNIWCNAGCWVAEENDKYNIYYNVFVLLQNKFVLNIKEAIVKVCYEDYFNSMIEECNILLLFVYILYMFVQFIFLSLDIMYCYQMKWKKKVIKQIIFKNIFIIWNSNLCVLLVSLLLWNLPSY